MYIDIFLRPKWSEGTWRRNFDFPTQLRSTFQGDLNAPVSESVSQSVFHSSEHWTEIWAKYFIMETIDTRELEENSNSLLHTTERQRLIQTPELPEAKRFCSLTHGKSESWSLIAHNTARQRPELSQHTLSSSFTPLIDSYIWMQVKILIHNQFHYY